MGAINVVTESLAMLSCVISRKQGILSKLITRECNLFKMSPRTRTLSSFFIFLSVNNGLVCSKILPGKFSSIPDFYPSLNGPIPLRGNPSPNAPSAAPDLLSMAKRLLAESTQPIVNEVITQPVIRKSPAGAIGPAYEQASVIVDPSPSLPAPNTEAHFNTLTPFLTQPEILPPQLEYTGEINQIVLPLSPMPIDPIQQSVPVSKVICTDRLAEYPELAQFYQPPIKVQVPAMPVVTPVIAVAKPDPALLPQNLFTSNLVADFKPNIVNQQIEEVVSTVASAPITIPSCFGNNLIESVASYRPQSPLSFEINMPSPPPEQPPVALSSANPAPICQDYSTTSLFPPMIPSPPVIVMERSRSSWRSLLPILLIAMCDGGSSNGCGNCCCCGGSNILIPYPIPMSINNPIILGSGKAKRNSTSASSDV